MMSLVAALNVAARAPLGQASDVSVPWIRIALVLMLCLALAVGAILVIRRRQGGGGDLRSLVAKLIEMPGEDMSRMAIEERIRVSAANQILVLRWKDARYLVHVAPSGAQLLDRQPASPVEGAS